jgi:HPt (histidine-containing phosphotransfer) domain-containing protein
MSSAGFPWEDDRPRVNPMRTSSSNQFSGAPGTAVLPRVEVQAAPLEIDALLHRVGGDFELLREIIDLFLEEAPRLAAEVRQAVARHDAPALVRAAHRLKGSAGNLSAQRVVHLALRLEMMGREEELAGATGLCEELDYEIAEVEPLLESLVTKEAA